MSRLPKGVYDELITSAIRRELDLLPPTLKATETALSGADAIEYLARKVADRLRAHLRQNQIDDADELTFEAANQILATLHDPDLAEPKLLEAITDKAVQSVVRPNIPLSQSALITNDQRLNFNRVLATELATSDRVDFICPFIGNQGLNLIWDGLKEFGSRLRVITTTYLGATNQRALERLCDTGAQVKIVYERSDQRTSLHAKAWIFHRDSGFVTATVGSSNLSPKALVDGLEWNVRLSKTDSPHVLQELLVTFERLWADSRFELFDKERDAERLRRALKSQKNTDSGPTFFADLHPLPHQEEALEQLGYARLEGRSENLIVAATGTGKTLLAAFDYQRMCRTIGGRPKLLFVAHREDILKQSLGAYQAVMKDRDFGELHVGEYRAEAWKHVFASVQSLSRRSLDEIDPTHFDAIVIDEFHHAEAPTYLRLLDHFRPKQLLGLTATPERTDGKNVMERFGTPTYELRLWHALERNLLAPFHYFGVNDGTDLSQVQWSQGRYSDADLERLFVDSGRDRARLVIRELLEKAEDISRIRAVAFCSTIRHAEFMAEQFAEAGLNARALHSGLGKDLRDELVKNFRDGDLSIICTVDLFNEGVDVPEINTVLFLRPTESATIFIQQLGRGLRNHEGKGALTVLDFVGQHKKEFRMDLRFRAMTGLTRSELIKAVDDGFPMLPPGCNIKLDRATTESVLDNLKRSIPTGNRALTDELRRLHAAGRPITLTNFLHETSLELGDLYKGRSFHTLKHAAGIEQNPEPDTKRVSAFIHIDDRNRAESYLRVLRDHGADERALRMIAFTLTGKMSLEELNPYARAEMVELLEHVQNLIPSRPKIADDLPFALHCHYSRDEIVALFRDNPASMRQGTFYARDFGLDIHFSTLRKSERDFSPTTRYADYFVGPNLFHWESQSTTSRASDTGQRLIHGHGRHLFFVRENKNDDSRTAPFLCLGFARPISNEGDRPIQIIWELDHAVPDHLYMRLKAAAG